jgi:hypothetical protein
MLDMPYFMTNPDWFFFDGEKFRLTETAPEKAKESLKQFYEDENKMLKGGK